MHKICVVQTLIILKEVKNLFILGLLHSVKNVNKNVKIIKYNIKKKLVLGHSDIAPLRKVDPGEKFPWNYLSSKGIGIYPKKYLKKKGKI